MIVLAAVLIVFNSIFISKLGPTLSIDIKPKNIKMGYFNRTEIGSILVYSKNTTLGYRDCSDRTSRSDSCIYYYWHSYIDEITCFSETRSFYKDCDKAESLTIQMFYLDEGLCPMLIQQSG